MELLALLKNIFSFDDAQPLLFTQFYFWVFFAFVFAVFSLFRQKILLRNTFLFFVSLFFYYKTSGLFTLILLFVTIFNFFIGKLLFGAKQKRFLLIVSIVLNLLVLCYFKYAYFFIDVLNDMFGTHFNVFDVFSHIGNIATNSSRFSVDAILLPVGISFYIFQAISYVMDIYRERIKPVRNFFDFAFYLTFFPQLVAGPIVRASEFIPQLHRPYFLGRKQFGFAVFWILNGLAKKIILSDFIAVNFVDRVFENPLLFSGFENLVALFGYSLQVYADFSGYTDIAIGVAMLMGFYLPKNFDSPYKATNPGNFWKRWHISLSKWLQDYLYIPLGGNRNATFGTYCCIFTIALIAVILSGSLWVTLIVATILLIVVLVAIFNKEKRKPIHTNLNALNTMLLGGLWHGASWNFMIWGGLNGLGIIVYKFWKNWNVYVRTLLLLFLTLLLAELALIFEKPVFNMFFVWSAILFLGTFLRMIYNLLGGKKSLKPLETCWAVFQTFIFITFTRLFFRSGSNLDPAEANETAWNTAKNMVNQIGSSWDFSLIPQIVMEYRNVFLLIVLGMIIHWLPDNFKRYYRICFAKMPLYIMAIVVVVAVFVIYQFVTADLQKFIYFQF
ncbi:MAG: MBOAT family protein [Paludibacteraceae bacterium]|nr:MBOAT family protein [Paludibacteraceae bacterium]MBO7724545.1 MBOAT family protein [Paludibacteraceae bacterium]